MCLIFISVNHHPTYRLIVAANRDEFYRRKTSPAAFWTDHPQLLAGRDLEAGGTWLGVTRKGKVSMVTNYRDPGNIDPKAPSRGHLVTDYLLNGDTPNGYLKDLALQAHRYNGFNLIVGDRDQLSYYSNYQQKIKPLTGGIYGLSNHLLDTPWPKVEKGKRKFMSMIANPRLEPAHLLDMMYDEERAPDESLPDTGIGLERERALSSMFIKTPDYGSRCSTVVMAGHDGHVVFAERVYELPNFRHTTQTFEFDLEE